MCSFSVFLFFFFFFFSHLSSYVGFLFFALRFEISNPLVTTSMDSFIYCVVDYYGAVIITCTVVVVNFLSLVKGFGVLVVVVFSSLL